jgi:voltage-gated potassium channel
MPQSLSRILVHIIFSTKNRAGFSWQAGDGAFSLRSSPVFGVGHRSEASHTGSLAEKIRMEKQNRILGREHWAHRGFMNLLVWFFIYLVIGPFLQEVPFAQKILAVVLTIILISALGAMTESRRFLRVATGFMVVAVILFWLRTTDLYAPAVNVSAMAIACFLMLLAYSFAKHLFRIRKVDTNTICAALCLYLVLGMLWGFYYAVLESIVPGSFAGGLLERSTSAHETMNHLQYFSYVTLSTLGYGDITPQNQVASALCQTEAIIGQFLTVVLVARLVGIQIAQESRKIDRSNPTD